MGVRPLNKKFLEDRGFCCGNGCRNCPYTKPPVRGNTKLEINTFAENVILVGTREYKYRGMIMSHMVSESLVELHRMARIIDVDRKHFQDKKGKPHYDISKGKKKLAMKYGAKEVDDREIIKLLIKNYR